MWLTYAINNLDWNFQKWRPFWNIKRRTGGLLRLWYIRISTQNVSQHTLETLTNEREISCVGVIQPFDKTAKMICWWPPWVEPTRHRWMGLMWSAYREQKIATNVWNVLGQSTSENIYFLPHSHWKIFSLTHWGRDKIYAISQTTFWSALSWMKMFEFRLKFHVWS